MATTHASHPEAARGPGLPPSITPDLLERLAARVSAAPHAVRVTTNAPYTGQPLADLPVSTPADVEAAFARARIAPRSWAATPIDARKRILLRYHDLVLARRDEALDLMQAENGKTRRDAFLEVVDIGVVSRYYARTAGGSVRDRFVAAFVARTEKLRIGAAYDYSMDVGSLTTPSQLRTVTEHVDDAVAKGATVLAGGKARPDLGPLFHEPTILTDVTPDMTVHDHETFGPVVSVYSYRDTDEAVARANATPYGLNAVVWTRDGARGRAVAARIHAGTVNVNEAFAAAWGSVDAPMGGMGDSGLGRRHGADGILKYTEAQTVAHQRVQGFHPPPAITPERWATLLTRALKVMKAVGVR
ncbi:aldehyde dehydrogenase family protein [Streptomyces sp. NPDC055055]